MTVHPREGALTQWYTHVRTQVSKIPPNKLKLFSKKTPLNKYFVLFHIKLDPLSLPDLKKKKKKKPFYLKINIFRPLLNVKPALHIVLQKRTLLTWFFIHTCVHQYIWVAPPGQFSFPFFLLSWYCFRPWIDVYKHYQQGK